MADCPILKTVTLGCKVNQYESEYLRQGLAGLGYRDAAEDETADLCIVNTCAVTAEAARKSRSAVRRLAKENPGARIIIIGCLAALAPGEMAALPGVCEVVADKRELPALLARLGVVNPPEGIAAFGQRQRAFVKVQDGCRMGCSYCIIPTTRPVLMSRPPQEVLDEISRLVDGGHREIVLTGIHLGHYGVDIAGQPLDLAGLLSRIVQLDGDFRVRISSIEADEATSKLLAVMADNPGRICPHLHLSMQSGSDAVLRRMRRRQSSREFVACCQSVRRILDNPALTTDAIVGFPGETEEEFAETCRVVKEIGFSKIHIFRFSPRQGTPAADMPRQVPGEVQHERAARLAEIEERLRTAFWQSLVGSRLQVMIESRRGDGANCLCEQNLLGTSARYVPVELPTGSGRIGELVEAMALRVAGNIVGCVRDAPKN